MQQTITSVPYGQRVKVYYNLHKKVWSVLTKTPRGWRLYDHADQVCLTDVTWKVSEAGRQRVLREKRKNVHAFAIGTLLESTPIRDFQPVRYNPYECGSFCMFGQPITNSEYAIFTPERRVFACQ